MNRSHRTEIMEQQPEISFRARFGLWAAAWGLATIATAGTSPSILFWAWLFPIGLLGLFTPPGSEFPLFILVAGWLFYLGLSIYGLAQKERARYFVVYALLIVFLLFNVAGCHVQM